MPAFTPGKYEGKAIDVTCLMPIRFINKSSGKSPHGFLNGDFPETLVIGMGPVKSSQADKNSGSFQIEQNPLFPGPYPFTVYIRQNLKYPLNALKEKTEGKVQVFFTVNSKGKVENVKAIYGKNTELNEEAMRVVSSMPNWIPGKRNGKPVDVNFTTWVDFKLQSKPSTNVIAQEFSPAKGEPYTIVEEMPKFPTGNKGFWNFIASQIRYPEKAKKNNIQGTVNVTFVVNAKGKIEKPKITRSIDPEMDAEALRVISSMPNLIPGKIKGMPVDVKMTVPVKFALEAGEQSSINA
jgi:TonB family protein